MQLVGAVLLACLAGLAQAKEKQINVGAQPPPPATSATVPGAGFGVVVPGYTTSTWTQANSDTICKAMIAATSGYDKAYIKCTVESVTAQGTAGATAIVAGGYLYWAAYPGSNINSAEASRNALVTLLQDPSEADAFTNDKLFKGSRFNYACDPTWAPLDSTDVSGWLPVLGFQNARCKVAKMGFTGAPFNDAETAGFPTTTVKAVGIDNGKTCNGDVIPTTASSDTNRQIETASMSWVSDAVWYPQFGCYTGYESSNQGYCWLDLYYYGNPEDSAYLSMAEKWDNIEDGQTFKLSVTSGTGIDSVMFARQNFDGTGADTYFPFTYRPTSACQQQMRNILFANENTVYTTYIDGNRFYLELRGDLTFGVGSLNECSYDDLNENTTYWTYSGGVLTIAGGDWSPLCDTDIDFYEDNSAPKTTTNLSPLGYACPTCFDGVSNTRVLFNYNGPSAGQFCTEENALIAPEGINGEMEKAVPATVSVLSDASCVRIGVSKESNGNAGKPMLPDGDATTATGRKLAVADIFPPTTRTANAGAFSQNAVRAFVSGGYADVALDTVWAVPCSTPAITQPPTNTVTAFLGKIDAGTCNTKSIFNNGFSTGTTADSHAYDFLAAPVIAPVINPSPTPAPAPAPSNGTSPTPAPTPAPSPAPSTTCTYSGKYQIQSVACAGKYLAFSLSANDNLVYLRSTSQSSPPRTYWNLDATAVVGETPAGKAIFADKTGAANQLAHPDSGPKLGGSSWKYKIVPDTTTADCNVVRLAGNGRPSASKYLGVNDSCTGFTWSAQSTNPGQTFKLNKA